ncbi:MAG: hypothetical protein HQL69_16050 [Magnetococcales bacterium]|nr:hypothetical protein [Magnetococcales bacterium]
MKQLYGYVLATMVGIAVTHFILNTSPVSAASTEQVKGTYHMVIGKIGNTWILNTATGQVATCHKSLQSAGSTAECSSWTQPGQSGMGLTSD